MSVCVFASARWATSMAGAVLVPAVAFASPAVASGEDDFKAVTTDSGHCGVANFHDFGEPGGQENDDYLVIHDYCYDEYSVLVETWVNNGSHYVGYNDKGYYASPVAWDPYGDIQKGDTVFIKVCLVRGSDEGTRTLSSCGSASHTSING